MDFFRQWFLLLPRLVLNATFLLLFLLDCNLTEMLVERNFHPRAGSRGRSGPCALPDGPKDFIDRTIGEVARGRVGASGLPALGRRGRFCLVSAGHGHVERVAAPPALNAVCHSLRALPLLFSSSFSLSSFSRFLEMVLYHV